MSNIVVFGLGFAVAIMVAFIIVMVVVMFRLNKKIKDVRFQTDVNRTNLEEEFRNRNSEIARLGRAITDHYTAGVEDAKKYTDSRIDVTLNKISKEPKI